MLDLLEPAQVAGLVREEAVETFVFEHALVRDTAYDGGAHAGSPRRLPSGRTGRRRMC